jgi:hypothetical protein
VGGFEFVGPVLPVPVYTTGPILNDESDFERYERGTTKSEKKSETDSSARKRESSSTKTPIRDFSRNNFTTSSRSDDGVVCVCV